MAKTQRNKATAGHLGLLKARLAKLRRELLTPKSGGGGPGEGFDVAKTGDARIGFVGECYVNRPPALKIFSALYQQTKKLLINLIISEQLNLQVMPETIFFMDVAKRSPFLRWPADLLVSEFK